MERYQAKICAIFGLLVIPFIFTILPLRLSNYFTRKGEKGKQMLSCLMCFGGGVFFAVFMLHMAPEARAIIEISLERPYKITYPISDLLMSFGFFMIMFLEMGVTAWSTNTAGSTKKQKSLTQNNHNHNDHEVGNSTMPPNNTSTFLLKDGEEVKNVQDVSIEFADKSHGLFSYLIIISTYKCILLLR